MKLRTVLFWLHLCAGVSAGVVILIMSVTGALLTFQQTILRTIERSQRYVDGAGLTLRACRSTRCSRACARAIPGRRAGDGHLRVGSAQRAGGRDRGAGHGLRQSLHRRGAGHRIGAGARVLPQRDQLASLSRDERRRSAPPAARSPARAMRRSWCWRSAGCTCGGRGSGACGTSRAVTWFRRGVRGRARDFNWHNTIGFWCAPVLIVLTMSGMVISYTWASNLVYTITGSPRPVAAAGRGGGPGGRGGGQGGGRGGRGAVRAAAARRLASDAPRRGRTRQRAGASGRRRLRATAAPVVADRRRCSSARRRVRCRPGARSRCGCRRGPAVRRRRRSQTARTGTASRDRRSRSTAGPAPRRDGSRTRRRLPARSCAAGCASRTPASSAAWRARRWPGWPASAAAFLVWTGLALSLRRFAAWRAAARGRAAAGWRRRARRVARALTH